MPFPIFLSGDIMNVTGLVDDLELYIDIQNLKLIGLTNEEITGFILFDWDVIPSIKKSEEIFNDK